MNETFHLSLKSVKPFLFEAELEKYAASTSIANQMLHDKSGLGNDFLGWVDLPFNLIKEELAEMQQFADNFAKTIDYLVVIGIGGSYLGTKAVVEALTPYFPAKNSVKILYAGHQINQDYLFELNQFLKDKNFGICVISKSGTTTEPALAFRLLKQTLEDQAGKAAAQKKIIAITDESKGALRTLATKENYATFVIPDDVGGRYSVLTPVGLIPIAIAGFDITRLISGAQNMHAKCGLNVPFEQNPAAQYAAVRNALYLKSFATEILVNYNDKLHFIAEWWKQLFGESEGKENKGIFPASVDFSTDLHSMGQYIQEGKRHIFETVISVKNPNHSLNVPMDEDNLDKLNFLAGKSIDHVNKMAELGTRIAHTEGGVPNILIEIDNISEFTIGQLFYFFEKACGIGGYLLNVNPFDQPGVEAYKNNMFALLHKPGFEKQTEQILKKIQ